MSKIRYFLHKNSFNIFSYVVVAALSVGIFWQFIDKRNFFLGDDFIWLYQAIYGRFVPILNGYSFFEKFGNLSFFYHIIPLSPYLDRPVTNLAMYVMYSAFGLSCVGYYVSLFVIHLLNLVLLYEYEKRYVSKIAALIGTVTCAVWFSSLSAAYRINALADVIALTFCLLSLLAYKGSSLNESKFRYFISVAFYFIAIRSKEYAIGLFFIILMQEVLLNKKSVLVALKDLWAFVFVFVAIVARYLYLICETKSGDIVTKGSSFHLSYDLFYRNTLWYVRELFYQSYVSATVQCVLLLLVFIALVNATGYAKKLSFFCIFSFLSLLGPLLFLEWSVSDLYLYGPHFFMAFGLSALLDQHANSYRQAINSALIGIVVLFIAIIPYYTKMKFFSIEWYLIERAQSEKQLNLALPLIQRNAGSLHQTQSVFVSGVVPGVNVFEHGWALRIFLKRPETDIYKLALKVFVLGEHGILTEEQFIKKFCDTQDNKIYIEFSNDSVSDKTSLTQKKCGASLL